MPKFIGSTIDGATHDLPDNAMGAAIGRTRLTYAQARLMLLEAIHVSLDTTDKGFRGSYAKRWHRFFATPLTILASVNATDNMLARAGRSLDGAGK